MPIDLRGKLSSGAKSMIMPYFISGTGLLSLKDTTSTGANSTSSGFYSPLNSSSVQDKYETATLQPVSNTLEQTIIDTGTGKSGILTQAKSSSLSAAGNVTIRVYIDGAVTEFTEAMATSSQILCIGDFLPWFSASGDAGYLQTGNAGYGDTSVFVLGMLSPKDSATRGLPIGMVFTDSLKVTVQSDVNVTVGSSSKKAVACWLDYIPEGVL